MRNSDVTEIVDRVARAICGSSAKWNDLPESKAERRERRYDTAETRDDYRDDARLAISAMREPTEFMVHFGHGHWVDGRGSISIYQAMIDAALAE